MGWLEVILLALALSIDAFSVGAVVGTRFCSARQIFRLSFHFGLFQALLPLLGALGGHYMSSFVGRYDRWVAFGLLLAIGVKMFTESFKQVDRERDCPAEDATRGLRLIGLSLAVSIDAFGAGVSMALTMAWQELLWAAVVIGLVAAACTWLGMRLGQTLVDLVGRKMEAFGGLVLVGLGVNMVIW